MADSYGTSLLVDEGDLVIQGGSLVEVRGLPNLIQGLTLRVFTPFATDIFSPTYGFDLSAIFGGSMNTRARQDLISLNLVRTLSGDRRVREVRDIQFRPARDGYRRTWPVDVTVISTDSLPATIGLRLGG
ncbi:MAG TPA: hypothetical protein VJT14_04375 [Candidatus Dormibacteraeota bacterium]|nr:hypothetical protein [Candidatus Dormibacteraeota bacterium]